MRHFQTLLLALLLISAPNIVTPLTNEQPAPERYRGHMVQGIQYIGDETYLLGGAATLITPTVMVGAAHIQPALPLINDIFVCPEASPDPQTCQRIEIADIVTHPDWDPSNLSDPNDVAVFLLEEPIHGVPLAVLPPVGFLDQTLDSDQAYFTLVGFGRTDPSDLDSAGSRNMGKAFDALVEPGSVIFFDEFGASLCVGDSGAAAYYKQSMMLVGIGSFLLGADCEVSGATRLDTASARAFLDPFVP